MYLGYKNSRKSASIKQNRKYKKKSTFYGDISNFFLMEKTVRHLLITGVLSHTFTEYNSKLNHAIFSYQKECHCLNTLKHKHL